MKFSDSLDRKLEEINRPPNPPVGHYIWQISKHPEIDEFTARATGAEFERVTVQLTCVEASDDVDQDDLAEFGNIQGYTSRKTFMFPTDEDEKASYERSLFNFRRFLGHAGVAEDMPLNEAMAEAVGNQILGELKHRPDNEDPEVIYAEIGKTAEV